LQDTGDEYLMFRLSILYDMMVQVRWTSCT